MQMTQNIQDVVWQQTVEFMQQKISSSSVCDNGDQMIEAEAEAKILASRPDAASTPTPTQPPSPQRDGKWVPVKGLWSSAAGK